MFRHEWRDRGGTSGVKGGGHKGGHWTDQGGGKGGPPLGFSGEGVKKVLPWGYQGGRGKGGPPLGFSGGGRGGGG